VRVSGFDDIGRLTPIRRLSAFPSSAFLLGFFSGLSPRRHPELRQEVWLGLHAAPVAGNARTLERQYCELGIARHIFQHQDSEIGLHDENRQRRKKVEHAPTAALPDACRMQGQEYTGVFPKISALNTPPASSRWGHKVVGWKPTKNPSSPLTGED